MNKREIGNLIYYERTRQNIGLSELASGVCSVSVLQRLENGERLPEPLILERLVERLGKSMNKMELLYHKTSYDIYYLREAVECYVEEQQYEEAAEALIFYESLLKGKEALHWQYICKMRAVLAVEQEGDHGKAAMLLEEAMGKTLPGFDLNSLDSYLLGESELLLLLMWIQEKIDEDVTHIGIDGNRLLRYIQQTCQDEEVLANVYSKAAWVLGNVELKGHNPREALWYTLEGQKRLADALDIDQKTVSRLEGGKYKPKQGTFQKIKEYLEIHRDICSTRLVVEDFALLEMEREIARKNYYKPELFTEQQGQLLKSA